MWDYAWLSKVAKAAGGPEALLRAVKGFSAAKGAIVALPAGIAIGVAAKTCWDKVKDQGMREEEEFLAACRKSPVAESSPECDAEDSEEHK